MTTPNDDDAQLMDRARQGMRTAVAIAAAVENNDGPGALTLWQQSADRPSVLPALGALPAMAMRDMAADFNLDINIAGYLGHLLNRMAQPRPASLAVSPWIAVGPADVGSEDAAFLMASPNVSWARLKGGCWGEAVRGRVVVMCDG